MKNTEKVKIYVEESEENAYQMFVQCLNFFHFNMTCASYDETKLLQYIHKEKPQVLILDMHSEKLNIPGILEKCQFQEDAPKVILMTSDEFSTKEQLTDYENVTCFSMKPMVLTSLKVKIQELLLANHILPIDEEERKLEIHMIKIFHQLDFPLHLNGYYYLKTAILEVYKDKNQLKQVTKSLYPSIAEQYKSTPSRVERSIRHAIEVMWDRGSQERFDRIFEDSAAIMHKKPTNSEFISLMLEQLQVQMAMEN